MMLTPDRFAHLGELLREATLTFKSEVALITYRRGQEYARYTYLEFKHRAEALAGWLREAGIGPGDRVAVMLTNQPGWLEAAYAVFARGAVLVPLDYKLDADTQKALLTHSGARILFTEYGLMRRLDACPCSAVVREWPESEPLPSNTMRWEAAAATPGYTQLEARSREDTATIVYSSGTSGRPKGCMLSHGAYLSQYGSLAALYPITTGDRYFSILPTNHAIDFMVGFIGPFGGGATVVHEATLRPDTVRATLAAAGITHMAVVPLLLEAFERRIDEAVATLPQWKQRAFHALERAFAALSPRPESMPLRARVFSQVHAAFGGKLKMLIAGGAWVDPRRAARFTHLGIPVVIGYGLTEACTVVTVNDLKPFRGDSVGIPLPGLQVEVRSATGGDTGEVWVKGPSLMQGYLDDPTLTAETLVDGWLRTGDIGCFDATGHLQLLGRQKNMIVTAGGKNVYPEDVESSLELAGIEELAVFSSAYLWPQTRLGAETLVAVVRPALGTDVTALTEALKARSQTLPEHKRIGAVVTVTEAFPRTASMKVKRETLAEILRNTQGPEAAVPVAA